MPQLRCERCGMMADVCSEGVLTDGNFGDIPSKPLGIRVGMRYVLLCPKRGLQTHAYFTRPTRRHSGTIRIVNCQF
jgi:hypothetical protein